jgi:hypothetical protein
MDIRRLAEPNRCLAASRIGWTAGPVVKDIFILAPLFFWNPLVPNGFPNGIPPLGNNIKIGNDVNSCLRRLVNNIV